MTATTAAGPRIATLDIVRGVAVMGILAMNIVAFAMPFQAYMNPAAFGSEGTADYLSWLVSFVFVDGKMRGLFSFLFGASMLLVIERAAVAGDNPARVHFPRMLWLLAFGLVHFYFIWFGDILSGYALVGMVAYLFHRLSSRALVRWGMGLLVVQCLIFLALGLATLFLQDAAAAPGADAATVAEWQALKGEFGVPGEAALAGKMGLHLGPWSGLVGHRLGERLLDPFTAVLMFGWETLAYFLFGMVALRNGFLRGEWTGARYRKWMLVGFGVAVPVYALLALLLWQDGFSVPMVILLVMAATVPFRPLMVAAIAALIILATRRGGALVDRIAAAGRAAFTNYLGTSIVMTTLFYGYGAGLYGSLSRAELWIPVVAMWALILLWSKPWLERYRYGPLEWLWRSLARGAVQPMRRASAAAAPAAAE